MICGTYTVKHAEHTERAGLFPIQLDRLCHWQDIASCSQTGITHFLILRLCFYILLMDIG